MKKILKNYIKLLRCKHWIKNLLIFVPLFFSRNISVINIFTLLIGIFLFSLASSCIYIINDIKDIESDKLHPVKKDRPLASGVISKKNAIITIIFIILLIFASFFFIDFVNKNSYFCIIGYVLINIFYSFGFKNVPILDITLLASGFVLRVFYGGMLLGIDISAWLYLTILFMSFYLGLGKRKNEIMLDDNKKIRKVLNYYSKDYLEKNMYVCLGMTLVFYALWCKEYINQNMMFTIPLVMIICMRYSLNIEKNNTGDPVEVLLKDKWLQFLVFIYACVMCLLYYFF